MPRYVPEPTPVSDNITELQRYIDVELRRISESLNVKVDGAYAGLFQDPGITVITPLTATPVLFTAYDGVTPVRPDGVVGVAAAGSLAILTPGTFILSFTTTLVNILANEEWAFLLARNAVSTGIGGVVEPSNQTEIVTVSFTILFSAAKGDVFTVLINSVSDSDASVTNSQFICNRVSEEF